MSLVTSPEGAIRWVRPADTDLRISACNSPDRGAFREVPGAADSMRMLSARPASRHVRRAPWSGSAGSGCPGKHGRGPYSLRFRRSAITGRFAQECAKYAKRDRTLRFLRTRMAFPPRPWLEHLAGTRKVSN